MGMHATAHLFYGFVLEEGEEPWDGEQGWEEHYAAQVGIHRPDAEYTEENKPLYKEYWRKKREAVKESGCEIAYLGHANAWMILVTVAETHVTADYADVKEVPAEFPGHREMLERFCDIMGIEWQEPRWLIGSSYG